MTDSALRACQASVRSVRLYCYIRLPAVRAWSFSHPQLAGPLLAPAAEEQPVTSDWLRDSNHTITECGRRVSECETMYSC